MSTILRLRLTSRTHFKFRRVRDNELTTELTYTGNDGASLQVMFYAARIEHVRLPKPDQVGNCVWINELAIELQTPEQVESLRKFLADTDTQQPAAAREEVAHVPA